MRYAGFWIRAVGFMVDFFILAVCLGIIHQIFDISPLIHFHILSTGSSEQVAFHYGTPHMMWISLLSLAFKWLYDASFLSSTWQGTPGMKLLGLKGVDYQGQEISFGRATLRHFASWLSAILLGLGYLMIAFTPRKQGLHDYIAETLIVHKD